MSWFNNNVNNLVQSYRDYSYEKHFYAIKILKAIGFSSIKHYSLTTGAKISNGLTNDILGEIKSLCRLADIVVPQDRTLFRPIGGEKETEIFTKNMIKIIGSAINSLYKFKIKRDSVKNIEFNKQNFALHFDNMFKYDKSVVNLELTYNKWTPAIITTENNNVNNCNNNINNCNNKNVV